MSDPLLQTVEPVTESKAPRQPAALKVGEPIKQVCALKDVAQVLGVSLSHIYQLYRDGKLNKFLLAPLSDTDTRPRFSGRKLQAWAEADPDGRREFFKLARKR